ncbi:PulJ/GspJ family protein [Poriferisphaera sp. WC338]|uniref:PulJ/GspJ family protein n=1 Tax=Poriferisphaera sp. WC338 TaxID=3425129 RepID=UPI003D817E69
MRTSHRYRIGFTLIEMVVSMAVMSIILSAIGVTLAVSLNTIPSVTSPEFQLVDRVRGWDQFIQDMHYAQHILQHDEASVAVVVDDRNGNGNVERIEYTWSDDNKTLKRTYNGVSHTTVFDNLEALKFGYILHQGVYSFEPPVVESENLIARIDTGVLPVKINVKENLWQGSMILPKHNLGDEGWILDAIYFYAQELTSDEVDFHVECWTVGENDGLVAKVLEKTVEVDLTNHYKAVPVIFSEPIELELNQKVFVFVKSMDAEDNVALLGSVVNAGMAKFSTDQGKTWNDVLWPGVSVAFKYRKLTSQDSKVYTREHFKGIEVHYKNQEESEDQNLYVNFFNQPQLSKTVLYSDFSTTLANLDITGNGIDWSLESTKGNLSTEDEGYLSGEHELKTLDHILARDEDYVLAHIVASSSRKQGSLIDTRTRVDVSETHVVETMFELTYNKQQEIQSLTFSNKRSGDWESIVSINHLPMGYIDIRQLIDPDRREAYLIVQGAAYGPYDLEQMQADNISTDMIVKTYKEGAINSASLSVIGD